MKENLGIVVYTNETYLDLLNLTVPFLLKSLEKIDVNIYVVSNKFKEPLKFERVEFIESNTSFSGYGSHFSKTLSVALNKINENYILLLCDDYLVKSEIKKNVLESIVDLLIDYNIDYFNLGTQKHYEAYIHEWKKLDVDYKKYQLPENSIYEIDNRCRHLYSVQPSIWKKSSLIEILKNNPELSLHDLDNTNIRDIKGNYRNLSPETNFIFFEDSKNYEIYNFKNICFYFPTISYHVDEKIIGSDYIVLDYIEIVRHGKFLDAEVNSKILLNKILDENIQIKNKLKKFF